MPISVSPEETRWVVTLGPRERNVYFIAIKDIYIAGMRRNTVGHRISSSGGVAGGSMSMGVDAVYRGGNCGRKKDA